jgi:flavodoxin
MWLGGKLFQRWLQQEGWRCILLVKKGECTMKALVIYDSAFGNTAQIAQVIGDTLSSHGEAAVRRVDAVQPGQLAAFDLVVVGSPTQGFRPTAAMNQFLEGVATQALRGKLVAAFDTRLSTSETKSPFLRLLMNMGGYAASRIAKQLKRCGGKLIVAAEGFFVEGKEGPLMAGERDRAADWAKQIITAQESAMRPQAHAA